MLGHDVRVFLVGGPPDWVDGILDRMDELGVVVTPQEYGKDNHPVFVPMHRVTSVESRGRRSR